MARSRISKKQYNKEYSNYLRRYRYAEKKFGKEFMPQKIERVNKKYYSVKDEAMLKGQNFRSFSASAESEIARKRQEEAMNTRLREIEAWKNYMKYTIPAIFKYEVTKREYASLVDQIFEGADDEELARRIEENQDELIEAGVEIYRYESEDGVTDKVQDVFDRLYDLFGGTRVNISRETEDEWFYDDDVWDEV